MRGYIRFLGIDWHIGILILPWMTMRSPAFRKIIFV